MNVSIYNSAVSRRRPKSAPNHIRLPAWFRVDRNNVQLLGDLVEWPERESVRLRQPISKEKIDWINHTLCIGFGESTRLDSLCERAGKLSLWDHVLQKELNFQAGEVGAVLYLLYDLRAQIYIRSFNYLRGKADQLTREEWFYLVALFLDRFSQWKDYTSSSMAMYYLEDLFGLVLKEGLEVEDVVAYIGTTMNALKWTSISGGRHNNFLSRMSEESITKQAEVGQQKISSARRHKSLRNKFLASVQRSDLSLFFRIPKRF